VQKQKLIRYIADRTGLNVCGYFLRRRTKR